MSIFDFFRPPKKPTAKIAKDRLQILLAHERSGQGGADFLPRLQQELLAVIRKYDSIDDDRVAVRLDNNKDNISVLEVNIELSSSPLGASDKK